jgi:NADH dehydrogenase
MRWVLVEAAGGILPEIGDDLGTAALERLRERGIEVFLETRLESATDGNVVLTSGENFPADTLVWTAGVRAEPTTTRMNLPVDERGRIKVDTTLRVIDHEHAWAAGDCAAVPDATTGGIAPPTAQHALREARLIAANIAAVMHGEEPKSFSYRSRGGLVSLGRYKGVARVMGVPLRGFPAWFVHRTYHVLMIPTFNRKARVLIDWTVALFFRRDIVQLGSLAHPRDAFAEAAGGDEERSA